MRVCERRENTRRSFLEPLFSFVQWHEEGAGNYRQRNTLSSKRKHEKLCNFIAVADYCAKFVDFRTLQNYETYEPIYIKVFQM